MRRTLVKSMVVMVLLACMACRGITQWTQTSGMYNQRVKCLLPDASGLYAGTGAGLYRSTDKGETWESMGLTMQTVSAVAVLGNDIFAGLEYPGLVHSSNEGRDWLPIDLHPGWSLTVRAIGVLGEVILAGTDAGIFRSTDAGKTWQQPDSVSSGMFILSMSVTNDQVYAGSTNGILVSTDAGSHWEVSREGVFTPGGIYDFAVLDTCVFATSGDILYRSTDKGHSWHTTEWPWGDGPQLFALAVVGEKIYLGRGHGISISTDRGTSWKDLVTDSSMGVIWSLEASSGVMYAGDMYHGVYTSIDSGATWSKSSSSMSEMHPSTVALSGDAVFVAGGWIYRSTDDGASWAKISGGFSGSPISDLAIADSAIYACSRVGIMASRDYGNTWTEAKKGLTNTDVQCLAASGSSVFAGTAQGVFRSTDKGANWQSVGKDSISAPVVDLLVTEEGNFAATRDHVFKSTDGGENWQRSDAGIESKEFYGLGSGDSFLYVCSAGWIYRSSDHGEHWTRPDSSVYRGAYRSFAASGSAMVTASFYAGVLLSTDHGTSWSSTGMEDRYPVSVAVGTRHLFVATYNAGIWRRPLSQMITTEVARSIPRPSLIAFYQNYPNPFNPSTTISYSLPRRSHITLTVFNVLGQQVAMLENGEMDAGDHEVRFEASNLPSGVYFSRLQVGETTLVQKLAVIK